MALRRTPESYTVTSPFRKGNFKPGHWFVTPLFMLIVCGLLGWRTVALLEALLLLFYWIFSNSRKVSIDSEIFKIINYLLCRTVAKQSSLLSPWVERLQVVDCYTDPLGWNKVADPGKEDNSSQTDLPTQITVCHDVTNLTSLLAYVLDSGQGIPFIALRKSLFSC